MQSNKINIDQKKRASYLIVAGSFIKLSEDSGCLEFPALSCGCETVYPADELLSVLDSSELSSSTISSITTPSKESNTTNMSLISQTEVTPNTTRIEHSTNVKKKYFTTEPQ
jgi:hypothetical protein